MENSKILFSGNKKNYIKIFDLMKAVDKEFIPSFSKRSSVKEELNDLVKNGHIIFLKENNEAIGFIGYYDYLKKYDSAFIKYIAVLKKYRKKGLGNLLMKSCLEDLKNRKIKNIKITTWSTNQIAQKLFRKCKFKKFKIMKNERGKDIDTIWFKLIKQK